MDDRDRTIISFGEDENKEPEVETKVEIEGAGFTMTPSEPNEEVKAEGSGFTMTPSEPKEEIKAEASSFNMKAETTGPSIPKIEPEFRSQEEAKAVDVHFGAAARNLEDEERVTETQKAAERKKSADVHFGAAARNLEDEERVTETQKAAERKKAADVHFGAAARNLEDEERVTETQKSAERKKSADVHFGAAARNIEEAERAAGTKQIAATKAADVHFGAAARNLEEESRAERKQSDAKNNATDVHFGTAARNLEEESRAAGTQQTVVTRPAQAEAQTAASQPRAASAPASDAERRAASQQAPASAQSAPRTDQQTAASGQVVGRRAAAQNGEYTPAHQPRVHAAPVPKKKKEKKYVTRGGLIACMLITMLLSAMLGLGIGRFLVGSNSGSGIAGRNDSNLSHLSLGDATGSELTVKEIIDMNADSVVEIVVSGTTQGLWGQLQLTEGAGSGVIVKENGYIATNYHVIQGANKIEVTLHNGDTHSATIVGSDAENDIAVIKIDAKDLKAATIGDSSTVNVGDLAVAIGNPLGQLGGTATTGIISALDRTLNVEGTTLTLLQTDAAINGGNSGGGLFNNKGELIGIVESKASAVGVEGLAFALPINSVSEIINDMIENGGNATKVYPAVGIVISDVSEDNAEYYGLDSAGLYIAQVTGENAKKAGFQEKDKIISIDGKNVSTGSEFIALVRKHKVGDTVTIVVSRSGQEVEIKTVLEQLQSE